MAQRPVDNKKKMVMLGFGIVIFAFSALIFYFLGGGKGKQQSETVVNKGLNTTIPSPELKTKSSFDKLSLYLQADKDSNLRKADEGSGLLPDDDTAGYQPSLAIGAVSSPFSTTGNGQLDNRSDHQADELEKKLQALKVALDQKQDDGHTTLAQPKLSTDQVAVNPELKVVEEMMGSLRQMPVQQDTELLKMDGMLDKILDIQYPERVKDRYQSAKANMQQGAVTVLLQKKPVLLDQVDSNTASEVELKPAATQFYELDQANEAVQGHDMAIPAVVHGDQLLVSGATIKMRLSESIEVNSEDIPAGTFIYGACNLSGERLMVEITSLQYKNRLFNVSLSAFDLDGQPGLKIPGSISRDASKQGTDQAIQAVAMSSLDPSLGAQAASAGIETAKKLMSRKVKLVKVVVKSDYPILLKDTNAK